MSLPFSLNASAGQGPVERAADRGVDFELWEPHPAPQAADLSDPGQKTREQPLGLVAAAVAAEDTGESDGAVGGVVLEDFQVAAHGLAHASARARLLRRGERLAAVVAPLPEPHEEQT